MLAPCRWPRRVTAHLLNVIAVGRWCSYNFIDDFRERGFGSNWTALPQFFKNAGYYTAGGGKVSVHYPAASAVTSTDTEVACVRPMKVYHPNRPKNNDMPRSWDVYFTGEREDDAGCRANETLYSNVCPSAEPDEAFYDWQLCNLTLGQLALAKTMNRPFFIAAGLRRPHRVWHVPKRFYDLYPNNGTDPIGMRLAQGLSRTGPIGMPELAFIENSWPEVPYNQSVPVPDRIAALGRWGYYAATSFTSYNVGRLLQGLDDLGLASSTVVALLGDHGWQLGEHGEWCKRTNFELGVRIPLYIRSPHHKASYGQQTDQLVEALDLYRTLVGLAGLSTSTIEDGVEGTDLRPIFDNPAGAPIKDAAFSQMARCPEPHTLGPVSPCNSVKRADIPYQGYSVRTDLYRYTVWLTFNGTANRADWAGKLLGEELYSHAGDSGVNFDGFENINMAPDPKTAATRKTLFERLLKRFARN